MYEYFLFCDIVVIFGFVFSFMSGCDKLYREEFNSSKGLGEFFCIYVYFYIFRFLLCEYF